MMQSTSMAVDTIDVTEPKLTTASEVTDPRQRDRLDHPPIPFARLLAVELSKMFDTRSGVWLLRSIAITAILASTAVVLWAPDESLTYGTFGSAVGIPMAVVLPIIAILSVTSEWSQRTGLATFTFVPRRGRVIAAKLVCAVGLGVAGILSAFAIGAIGNLVGSSLAGVDPVWDTGFVQLSMITLGTVLNMLIGFMLGVLLRNSAAAIVGYFVYGFVLTGLTEVLAATQPWFFDIRPWIDFNYSQGMLFETIPTAEHWAQLGTSGLLWLALPLAIGLRLVLRSEIK